MKNTGHWTRHALAPPFKARELTTNSRNIIVLEITISLDAIRVHWWGHQSVDGSNKPESSRKSSRSIQSPWRDEKGSVTYPYEDL